MTLTVLQIIPKLGAGGAEQSCVDIVAGLVAADHRALVVSAGGARVAEVERLGGVHIDKPVHSKNPFVILKNAFWLARFVRRERVHIVHARSRAPAWSAWIACRMTRTPYVTTFHAAYKFSNPLKKFYNRVMSRGDRIIAISQFIKDHIVASYGVDPGKIHVIYRGLDERKFAPESVTEERRAALRQAWGVKEGQRIVLLPARLSPIKGQRLFIDAMARLFMDSSLVTANSPPLEGGVGGGGSQEHSSLYAIIMGDDQGRAKYRLELMDSIMSQGLADKIKLVDHSSDMPAAYSLADVVVMPSLVPEGFGRVPVEAMAMGVPVIASDLGATVETVEEGVTGWRLPPDDPQAWAECIVRALGLSSEQRAAMMRAARQTVQAKFTREITIADTLAVYHDTRAND